MLPLKRNSTGDGLHVTGIMMNRKLWYGLAAIGLLRICMVAGFLRDIPPLIHEGWKFHQGGDQIEYFAIAR